MLTTRKDLIHFWLWVVQPTMILGGTARQHCCTPYDRYYRLITTVGVCWCECCIVQWPNWMMNIRI